MDVGPRPLGLIIAMGLPCASVRTIDMHAAVPAVGAAHTRAEWSCPAGEGAAPAVLAPAMVARPVKVAAVTARSTRTRMLDLSSLWTNGSPTGISFVHKVPASLRHEFRIRIKKQVKFCRDSRHATGGKRDSDPVRNLRMWGAEGVLVPA